MTMVWAFAAASVLWALSLPVSAAVQAYANGESIWRGATLVVYIIGNFVCHQRPERSFHLASISLPVCARCVGIYAGAALVGIVVVVKRSNLSNPSNLLNPSNLSSRARLALLVGALPSIGTLVYEWTTGRVPANAIRALSGAPLGAAAAFVVVASLLAGRSKP
jgi:uncharacterized membrane protein